MRTLLRFFLLFVFILSLSLFLHIVTLQSLLSSANISALLSDSRLYDRIATSINNQADNEGGGAPLQLTGTQIEGVIKPLLEQSISFVKGETQTPPTFSFNSLVSQVTGGNQEMLQQLNTLKTQVLTAKPANEEERKQQEQLQSVLSQPSKVISFEKQLLILKSSYMLIGKMSFVFLGGAIISLILILLLSASIQSKAIWIGIIGILTAIVMGVGAIIYSFPTSILSAMVASGEAKSGLAFAFMIPVLAQLVRYHVAVAIASLCFGVVGVLARFMVFRNNPAAMVEEKKSKK